MERAADRQTDRQTKIFTDRHINRQLNRQTWTDRKMVSHTHIDRHTRMCIPTDTKYTQKRTDERTEGQTGRQPRTNTQMNIWRNPPVETVELDTNGERK